MVCISSYSCPICWSGTYQYMVILCKTLNVPLILSILALSIFSPFQVSPSKACAYICHSERNPICIVLALFAHVQLLETYDLDRIIDFLVCPELSLDVHIAKHSLFYRQFLSMCSQNRSVQRDWRQKRRWGRSERPLRSASIRCRSK